MKAIYFASVRNIVTIHLGLLVVTLLCGSAPAQVLNPANSHSYEYVDQVLNWEDARQAAESRTFGGVNGYLATITSQTEQDFLASNFPIHEGWLGGLQTPGAVEPDQGWTWVTGEPFVYLGWSPSEPNNIFGDNPNENRIKFFGDGGGFWSDAPDSFTGRFFVEYNVPEPSSVSLAFLGSAFVLGIARRMRKANCGRTMI